MGVLLSSKHSRICIEKHLLLPIHLVDKQGHFGIVPLYGHLWEPNLQRGDGL